MKKSKSLPKTVLIIGLVLCAVGVVSMVIGSKFFTYLIQIVGVAVAVVSLTMLIMRLVKENKVSKLENAMLITMFSCALVGGILLIVFASGIVKFLAIILGAFVFLCSIMMIFVNLKYRERRSNVSIAYLIATIVVLISAVVLVALFFVKITEVTEAIAIVFGLLMLIQGVVFVLESFTVRSYLKAKENGTLGLNEMTVSAGNVEEAKVIEEPVKEAATKEDRPTNGFCSSDTRLQ